MTATTGDRRESGSHGGAADLAEPRRFDVLCAEGLHRSHRLESCLEHVDDVALTAPHFMRRALDRSPESRNEQQQKRRDGHDDEREVPVEPEHQAEHADDRHEIDEDAQRRRRHKVLDGSDVVRNRAEDQSRLVRVVVVEREAFRVVVQPQAEVIGHPLAHALRVVAVDVRRDATEHGEQHQREGRRRPKRHPVGGEPRAEQPDDPVGNGLMPDSIVDNDLEGPGACQPGGRFDQHRQQDDDEPAAIRAREIEHQTRRPGRRARQSNITCTGCAFHSEPKITFIAGPGHRRGEAA